MAVVCVYLLLVAMQPHSRGLWPRYVTETVRTESLGNLHGHARMLLGMIMPLSCPTPEKLEMIVPNVVPRPPALLKRNTFHYAYCTVYCKHISFR